jgi:hypothetical protein
MSYSLKCKLAEICSAASIKGYKGFCMPHYYQQLRGIPFKPVRGTAEYYAAKLNEFGQKQCTRCQRWLGIENFYSRNDASKANKWRAHCNKCNILRRMGITAKEYYAILEAQNGHCAICSATESNNGRELVVDHNHGCCGPKKACSKCIRALLCDPCNTAIGMLKDNSVLARKAADYLERFGK